MEGCVAADENGLDLAGCIVTVEHQKFEALDRTTQRQKKTVIWYDEVTEKKKRFISPQMISKMLGHANHGMVMTWYSEKEPTHDDVFKAYPAYRTAQRGVRSSCPEDQEVGVEIFGRGFKTRGEQRDCFFSKSGRSISLAEIAVKRSYFGERYLPANFLRGWIGNAFSANGCDIEDIKANKCVTCAIAHEKTSFECRIKLGASFTDVTVVIGDGAYHIEGLQSLIVAENKYSGYALETGHPYMYHVHDMSLRNAMEKQRVIRFAHRCARNRLHNVPEADAMEHNAIFDYTVLMLNVEDVTAGFLYKLLNTRYGVCSLDLPPVESRTSFSIFYDWLNAQLFIVGEQKGYLKEMVSRSRVYYPVD